MIQDEIKSVRQTLDREYKRPDLDKLEQFKSALWENNTALDYLRIERALSEDTIKHFQLGYDSAREAIAIPVFKNGELVNIKYRFIEPDKMKYTSESGAETWLFNEEGLQSALKKGGVLVVEGEMDLMSAWQAGFRNVVSPSSGKDSYGIWIELLDKIPKIYIAFDNDEPGKKSGRKFAERLGVDKCFEVLYPDDIKDANDFFKKYDKDRYIEIIKKARPYYSYQFKGVGDIIAELRGETDDELEVSFLPNVKIEKDWLVVIGGKSNAGKTQLSLNIANELALKGTPCLLMPFERGVSSVGKRFLSVLFGRSREDLKFTTKEEWDRMIDNVVDLPVYFATPNKNKIKDTVIRSRRLFDTKVVIIDHLDYIVRHSNGNRENEIANTMQDLKRLGEEMGIIFMVVTHIRKIDEAGSQSPRKPNMEDLKGSSSLYQDPECVALVYTEEVGAMTVNIAKNKGAMGERTFSVNNDTGRLSEHNDDF